MGLFDKKYCDICGGKIGLLGNRKLDDGNMCKDCAKLLSPWMTDRRHTTVADIKDHLAYREENKNAVAAFNVTRTLGSGSYKLYLDEDARKWFVTSSPKWRDANPDVLDYSQVTGCNVDIKESKREITTKDKDGKTVSYNPPRYEQLYDFDIYITVNSPWFEKISFRVNSSSIHGRISVDYKEANTAALEIKKALTDARAQVREEAAKAAAPKTSVVCPHCGATTIPDASGRCEYCMGSVL